jgi:hypothetical protein
MEDPILKERKKGSKEKKERKEETEIKREGIMNVCRIFR